MAMAGHLLQLKQPGRLNLSLGCSDLVRPTRSQQCSNHATANSNSIANVQLGGERLRHCFASLGGNSKRRAGFNLGFGDRLVVVAAVNEGEAREAEVVPGEFVDEIDPEENTSFPADFKELTMDRRDPPNLFLYAAGFCVIVLMRDVILREVAGWGLTFSRIGLYIFESSAIGLGKLTNLAAEPIAFLMAVVSWLIMAVDDVYTLIVDGAPVRSLANSLILSLAVLSIGDATTSKVRGSRSRLVGLATAIGLFGVLEFIPPEAVIWCLIVLTGFAKFIQRADPVTVFMPATVTFVAISEPVLRAAAFGLFLAVSVYVNWRATRQPTEPGSNEQTPSEVREAKASNGKRQSFVFSAITASICISLSAKILNLYSVKWLLLRSAMTAKTG